MNGYYAIYYELSQHRGEDGRRAGGRYPSSRIAKRRRTRRVRRDR